MKKKTICIMLTFALVFTFVCSTAFAGSTSRTIAVDGYGHLTGRLFNNTPVLYQLSTLVDQNPDNAFFSHKFKLLNSVGTTLFSTTRTSSRILVGYGTIESIEGYSDAWRVYSTHEVKGGGTYDSAAIIRNLYV